MGANPRDVCLEEGACAFFVEIVRKLFQRNLARPKIEEGPYTGTYILIEAGPNEVW